jgi:hypothetical protein
MPSAIITFTLNLLSGIVALLVSYHAYRFNRILDNSVLRSISIGFMLLGIGLLTEALTALVLGLTPIEVFAARLLTVFEAYLYLTLQLAAYVSFAWGYAAGAYGRSKASAAVAAVLLAAGLRRMADIAFPYSFTFATYFVSAILLGFVVFQGLLIRTRNEERFSSLVLLGFGLMLVAHVMLLASLIALSNILYVEGILVQFLGFVSLLVFLVRSGRIGPS